MPQVVKKPKFVPIETDTDTLKQVVKEAVNEFSSEQEEAKKREKRVGDMLRNKIVEENQLARGSIGNNSLLGSLQSTALGIKPDEHEHKHDRSGHGHDDCPTCSISLKKLGDGIEMCPDCKTVVTKPEAEFYICAQCGSPVPKSFLGTDKACPVCGSNKVHKTLHKK